MTLDAQARALPDYTASSVRLARQTGVGGASGATLLRLLSSLRSRGAGRAPPIDHAKTPLQRFGQFAKGRKRVGRQPALPLQAIEFGLASQEQIVDLGFTHANRERNIGAVGTVCPARTLNPAADVNAALPRRPTSGAAPGSRKSRQIAATMSAGSRGHRFGYTLGR